mmetsp:Transcript_59369/g.181069  ORF Transcript_59369/g.181069 Transcript_59369/m.181069 type:complete len:88 (-) Transcript_59369:547-810(-)
MPGRHPVTASMRLTAPLPLLLRGFTTMCKWCCVRALHGFIISASSGEEWVFFAEHGQMPSKEEAVSIVMPSAPPSGLVGTTFSPTYS